MIFLTTTNDQTVAIGAPIVFNGVVKNGGCKNCSGGPNARLTTRGNHIIQFTGNIGATTEATQAIAQIEMSGTPVVGGRTISTSEAAGDLNSASALAMVNNCCGDFGSISVINVGTTALNVEAGATLVIYKV